MHESALARDLLRTVLSHAEHHGAKRVVRASGWVAETETLSPDSLRFHFEALSRDTIAAGATLELRLIHVEARCPACGAVYAPEHHLLLCPRCGNADGELLGQTGLGLDTVEVESG
jgi:hydrogenase nickel incorporation protein HypA/HybF